jgi:proline iminopeptidase
MSYSADRSIMIPALVSIWGGRRIRASVAAFTAVFLSAACAEHSQSAAPATESRLAVDHTSLYVRVAGPGQPMIVLHGGPDFDTAYLLPEFDQLTDAYRLIYYDLATSQ